MWCRAKSKVEAEGEEEAMEENVSVKLTISNVSNLDQKIKQLLQTRGERSSAGV